MVHYKVTLRLSTDVLRIGTRERMRYQLPSLLNRDGYPLSTVRSVRVRRIGLKWGK